MHRVKGVVILLAAACLVATVGLRAQEHPKEHPKEHPTAKAISTAGLEKAIRSHIGEKAEANNGKFPVKDNVLNKTWQLSLVRVHTDKLTQLDENNYFACVDFTAEDGTAVDVDFFLKNEGGKLEPTDTTVHKINGQPRYNYVKKGDFWTRVPVGKAAEAPKKEHP